MDHVEHLEIALDTVRDGWIKNSISDDYGNHCFLGALWVGYDVYGANNHILTPAWTDQVPNERIMERVAAFEEAVILINDILAAQYPDIVAQLEDSCSIHVQGTCDDSLITTFNDAGSTKQKEVEAILEKAIARVQEEI